MNTVEERIAAAKDNAVLQAQIWAQEARTHRSTVLEILCYFGLPENDWEALRLIRSAGIAGVKAIPSVERINIEDTVGAAFAAQIVEANAGEQLPAVVVNPNWSDEAILSFIRQVLEGGFVIVQRRLPSMPHGVKGPDHG